jgi:hypothetical protein
MKQTLHTKGIFFRANPALVTAAASHAEAAGMTLTELLRASLRAAAQGRGVDGPLRSAPGSHS